MICHSWPTRAEELVTIDQSQNFNVTSFSSEPQCLTWLMTPLGWHFWFLVHIDMWHYTLVRLPTWLPRILKQDKNKVEIGSILDVVFKWRNWNNTFLNLKITVTIPRKKNLRKKLFCKNNPTIAQFIFIRFVSCHSSSSIHAWFESPSIGAKYFHMFDPGDKLI